MLRFGVTRWCCAKGCELGRQIRPLNDAMARVRVRHDHGHAHPLGVLAHPELHGARPCPLRQGVLNPTVVQADGQIVLVDRPQLLEDELGLPAGVDEDQRHAGKGHHQPPLRLRLGMAMIVGGVVVIQVFSKTTGH